MGSDGALLPANSVKWRQAHCTGPPLATHPGPWNARFELFQKHPSALSAWISGQALPLMARSGAMLTLALHRTAGKSNGRAGLGYTTRVLLAWLQASTSNEQCDVTSAPVMFQAAASSASLLTLKFEIQDTLCPGGNGSGRLAQPMVL